MCQLWDVGVALGLEEMVQVLQCGPSEMGLATFTPGVGVRGSSHKSHLGKTRKGVLVEGFCPWHFLLAFSSVQMSAWGSAFLLLCAGSSGAWLDSC